MKEQSGSLQIGEDGFSLPLDRVVPVRPFGSGMVPATIARLGHFPTRCSVASCG